MAYVPIPKDLKKVKTKVAFNLTKRQLIGFTIAGMIGIPIYLFMRKVVPNDIAVIFLIVSTLPIFSSLFLKRTDLALRNILSIFTFINFISHKKE